MIRPRVKLAAAGVLMLGIAAGCGGKSSKSSDTDDSSKTTGKVKTYTADDKGSSGKNGKSGSGAAALPSPADTTTGKPSAASDAGDMSAIKGQPNMTPGAPAAPPPNKH